MNKFVKKKCITSIIEECLGTLPNITLFDFLYCKFQCKNFCEYDPLS